MYVVSPALSESDATQAPDGLSYGVPIAFKGCSGFYHAAGSATGVVMCSPWGFEDLTMRKSWRVLAEAIAEAGYPCLRFDYPGTANSLGAATSITSVDQWVASISDAADVLRKVSGVRRFVFVGQSLGAALAVEAARGRSDVAGLQLIAPIVKGRAYVRELAATAKIVADRIGIQLDLAPDEGLSVLGFALSKTMVESLTHLDMTKVERLGVPSVTVFDQPDRKAGAEAAEHLRKLSVCATLEPIEPFHLMVSDATVIQPLPVKMDAVIAHLRAIQPAVAVSGMSVPAIPSLMVGADFLEEPIRFGSEDSLFGILCRPRHHRHGTPTFVLLNRGLNPHTGWRRDSVDHARGLAVAGFASLRIDVAGLGESRDDPSRPVNLIYSDLLLPDIRAAVDALVARGHCRIGLAGVCSGAFMALAAAHADPRISDVVAVNAQRIVWDPSERYEDVIRYGLRSVNDYVGDIKSGRHAMFKLVASRHRIVPAMRFLATRYVKNLASRVPLRWRSALMRNSMANRVHSFLETLASHGTRVSLVFSAGDPGLMELRNYFGPEGRDLAYPNVSVTIVPDADHNLTTTRAATFMRDHMVAFGCDGAPQEEPRAIVRPAAFKPSRAICPT